MALTLMSTAGLTHKLQTACCSSGTRAALSPVVFRGDRSCCALRHRVASSSRNFRAGTVVAQAAATATDAPAVPGLADTVWDMKKQTPKYPKLTSNVSADVCIIGAGIAGLSIAYNLVKAGKSVVVLDARTRGSGQTGRTTAHLMAWNDDYYNMLEKIHGAERTKIVAESHKKSIDWVEQVIKEENIDCNFSRCGGYLFPMEDNEEEMKKLNDELEASLRAGMTDVKMTDLGGGPEVGGINMCLEFPQTAEFHILDYLNGLADAVAKHGGKIYEMSSVKNIEEDTVTTVDDATVTAGSIVLATNSPINHNVAVHARQEASRSYVVGFKVPENKMKRACFWSTNVPYHYIRYEDTPQGPIMIVGGQDHPAGMKPEEYYDGYRQLEQFIRPRFPDAGEVAFKWTGQLYEPHDQLGLYGKDPLNLAGNQWVATGDSGQGMTGGTIAGIIIADQILGKDNAWSDTYSPSRVPPVSMVSLTSALTAVQTQVESYSDRFVVPQNLIKSVQGADPEPGTGTVLQDGVDRVAVFVGMDGKKHVMSAVCPHLGCCVQYDPDDKTWACPCHGSAFVAETGVCIQGPAKAGLAKAEYNE